MVRCAEKKLSVIEIMLLNVTHDKIIDYCTIRKTFLSRSESIFG